ncbi:UNVERIFIED_CONTAM: Serine/threonine-protein kinase stk11 [Siphonaria sp. JEL0065]|nr:Serine/threonine-protein kinase stk11 [Siphonaria sp. JEL0065]
MESPSATRASTLSVEGAGNPGTVEARAIMDKDPSLLVSVQSSPQQQNLQLAANNSQLPSSTSVPARISVGRDEKGSPKGSTLLDKTGDQRRSKSAMRTVSVKGSSAGSGAICAVVDEKTTPPQARTPPGGKKVVARSISVKSDMGTVTEGGALQQPQTQKTGARALPLNKHPSSLTSSRKSMPMMAKVNFGDEDEVGTTSNPGYETPVPLLPTAGRSMSVKGPPKSNLKKPQQDTDDDDDDTDDDEKKPRYLSTASLAKKKVSQQGKAARVQAALRKSMGDELHEAPYHQSAPVMKNNRISIKSVGGIPTTSSSPRESTEKPIIHMYPRKSVMSPQANSNNVLLPRSTSVQNQGSTGGFSRFSSTMANADEEGMPDLETRKSKIQAVSQSKGSSNAVIATASPPKSANDVNLPESFEKPQLQQYVEEEEEGAVEEEEPVRIPLKDDNQEYYDYVMLSQRHASSNFITKIGSGEIDYGTPETVVKIIGPYVMGEQIGKGAYGKVKEGLCSETLQRVAIKIINKKRLRKIPNGVENALSEIKLLRRMKHRNVITLIDVYCKVEDDEGNVGIFNWFSSIEDEPITWTYDDGSVAEKKVVVMKWYLVFEYCPCSLQTLLEQSDMKRLSAFQAHK